MNNAPVDNENDELPDRRSLRTRSDRYDDPEPARDSFFGDLIRFSLLSIAIVIPIRLFVASPFVVNGSSMDPTFHTGEYLIVDQLTYQFSDPERGDVVIFHYPEDPSKFFIKRVIGLPGETVILEGSDVRIINDAHPEGFSLDQSFLTHPSENNNDIFELGPGQYVVLGDNRTASSDSRVWGTVDEKLIVGRALLRLFPVSNIGFLPGDISPEELQK